MGRPPGSRNRAAAPQAAASTPVEKETTGQELAVFHAARLPFHPAVEDRFGIDKGQWKVLVEAIFPAAKTADAIVMALTYCKSRNLDPFKRPVHIVPVWDSARGGYVESVWPSISELRTTASRTGEYAGCDVAEFGPLETFKFKGRVKRGNEWKDVEKEITFPTWCRITVHRIVKSAICKFVGPKVLWREAYATLGASDVPNDMWESRAEGQLEKCAEAAALRRAFPEEIGNELTAEEMSGRRINDLQPIEAIAFDGAASRDTAPPRQIAQTTDAPKNDGPPRATKKPEPERLPDVEDGEITEDENPAPQGDSMDESAEHDDPPLGKAEPYKIPGKDQTPDTWADIYVSHIGRCETIAEVHKWIDANHVPLNLLAQKNSGRSAKVRATVAAKIESLRPKPKGDAKPPADKAPPRAKAAAKPEKAADGPGKRPDGHDPEEALKWIDATLAAVTNPDLLEQIYTEQCEPLVDQLLAPDKAEALALYQKHENRLGGD